MARNNSGRSTTGGRRVPEHYPTTEDRETAAYLRLQISRYLSGRANRSEVDAAFHMFAQTTAKRHVCSNAACEGGVLVEGTCLECNQEIRRSFPACAEVNSHHGSAG
jgi:hypothetical protein